MQLIFFYDLSFALTSAVKKRYLVHFGKQDCILSLELSKFKIDKDWLLLFFMKNSHFDDNLM